MNSKSSHCIFHGMAYEFLHLWSIYMPKCKYNSIGNKIAKEKGWKRLFQKKKRKLTFLGNFPFQPFPFLAFPFSTMTPPVITPSLSLTAARTPPVSFFLLPRLSPSEPSRFGIVVSRPSKTLEPFQSAPQLSSPLFPLISARNRAGFG